MSKKILIGIAILAIIGVGVFVIASKNKNSDSNSQETSQVDLKSANGIKCTQTVSVGDNNSVTNTMYFYKNWMRYDATLGTETQGQKDMHIISNGKQSFVWGKGALAAALGRGQKIGMITNIDDNDVPKPPISLEDVMSGKISGIPGLKCEAWSVNQSVFEKPKDIKFKTMQEMMMGGTKNVGEVKSPGMGVDCSACDIIPDPKSKADCRKSLECEE